MSSGPLYIILSALFWGLFPLLISKEGTSLHPLWNVALSTCISVVPFFILVSLRRQWGEMRHRKAIFYAVLSATFVGVCYYLLVFTGSHRTSPQNTSILLLLELVTSVVLLFPIREERLTLHEGIGALLLLFSAFLVVYEKMTTFATGDFILIIASLLTPFGNLYAKKASMQLSTEFLLLVRNVWSSIVLCIVAILVVGTDRIVLSNKEIFVLLTTGLLMLGISKLFWMEGLIRLKVTSALAIHCAITPFVTFVGAFFFFWQYPTFNQLIALPIGIFGAFTLLGYIGWKRDSTSCMNAD